jgi:hypothetical protein
LKGNYNYSKFNKYRSATSTFQYVRSQHEAAPRQGDIGSTTADLLGGTFHLPTTPQPASPPQRTPPHECLRSSTTIDFSPKRSKRCLTASPIWLRLALVCMPGHRHFLCTIRLARSLEDGRSCCALSKAPFMLTSPCRLFCMRRGRR